MKYEVKFTNQFKKDLKLAKKQSKNLDKLFEVVNILADGGSLDARYRDHLCSCYIVSEHIRNYLKNSPTNERLLLKKMVPPCELMPCVANI